MSALMQGIITLGTLAGIPLGVGGLLSYRISTRTHSFVNKVFFRRAVIECNRRGEKWRTPVYVRGEEVIGYRYPECKIGITRLRADGTGDYCGEITWRRV